MARPADDDERGSGAQTTATRGPVALRVALALAGLAVLAAALMSGKASAPASQATSAPPAPPAPATASATAAASSARVVPLTRVGAAHVLVAYSGAERAGPNVMRTKDEARGLAETVAIRLHAHPEEWNDVVDKNSDDATTKPSHGDIGNFERYAMPEAFSSIAFALNVGEISGVVETPLGFHVIRRVR